MATSFDIIEESFLDKLSDRDILNITPPELEDFLDSLLKSSFVKFRKCKQSLSYDQSLREIESDLTDDEIEILSLIMVNEWLRPKIYNMDIIKMHMSTRDYSMFSQANQIEKLVLLGNTSRIEYKQLIREYVERETDLGDLYG